jgi:2,3-bisphosphoglycerate-independent phosphoglycerate mutase
MKYIILLGDGMADYPIGRLSRRTPLEAASTPHMDRIAREGTIGLINTIPQGYPPGSDVANLSVLGYDPEVCYSGRGPLEAASMGIRLESNDVAFRCNLVSLRRDGSVIMDDYAAGHISSEESKEIIKDLDQEFGRNGLHFYPGVSYRHILVWRDGPSLVKTTPPHDIVGQDIKNFLPAGAGAEYIRDLMEKSQAVLKGHRINSERISRGKKAADSIWLWGQGHKPVMEPLTKKYGLRGAIISAVDLLKGIGIYAGFKVLNVKGATGYIDTDYTAKAQCALSALEEKDIVFVHVESPDEMGHEGNIEGKIQAIEDFDKKVVGVVLGGLKNFADFRIMVLSDHPTPISRKTHMNDPSPFAVLSSAGENLCNGESFCEKVAQKSGILILPGHILMGHFIGNWRDFIEKEGR